MPDGRPVLRFHRLPGAQDLPLPAYQSEEASGLDACAANSEPVVLRPGEFKLIPLGLVAAVPKGYEIQVRPRSGLAARNGLGLVNAPGTIDSDYRGEISVILINFGKEEFTVTHGMRIAQLVVQKVERPAIEAAETLEELGATERGAGGFGHTGI